MSPGDTRRKSRIDIGQKSHPIRSKLIAVRGDVDMNTASSLREKLQAAFARRPQVVILNLSQVTSMDSAGVAVLVEGLKWAHKERIPLLLHSPSKAAQAVIEMARLDKLFPVGEGNEPLPEPEP